MNQLAPLIIKGLARLPLAWLRALGVGLGNLAWLLKPRLVSHTQDNIAHCLPELSPEAQQQLARKSVQATFTTVLEAGYIWSSSWEKLAGKIVARYHEDLLRTKIDQGKGVLVLVPHMGNWEVL